MHNPPTQHTDTNRSTVMNTIHEELARAQIGQRLAEAHSRQRGQRITTARRLSRRAERAAQAARLAAARI